MLRRATLRLVLVLILSNLPAASPAAAQQAELPSGYVGTWEGTGVQTDPGAEWRITLSLTGGAAGSVVGSVDYPDLGCGGELTFLGPGPEVEGVKPSILLSEDITYGEAACVDGGSFELWLLSDTYLSFYWESPGGASTVGGKIPRTRGNVSNGTTAPSPDWQQAAWEGLTISYPPGHTFYAESDAAIGPPVRAAAFLQPTDCMPASECPILVFRLSANGDGLSPENWAYQNNRVLSDARNFRDVVIAGQTGIAFETGDPNAYPGESSVYVAPVGTDMLEVSGLGYQDTVEQIVASITTSASRSGEALLPAEVGGAWAGTVLQLDNQTEYPVEMTLTAGSLGPIVGEIAYPSLGCGGELEMLTVNQDSVELREHITADDTADGTYCIDGGTIEIKPADDGTLDWTWYWPEGSAGPAGEPGGEARLASTGVGGRTVVVFLEGIGTELTADQIDSADGGCSSNQAFGAIKTALLDAGFACGDFLSFSYRGGAVTDAGEWLPEPYGCRDTGQSLSTSIDHLRALLLEYRRTHLDVRFVLIGHSLGGVVALETTEFVERDLLLPAGAVAAVVTVDSPVNHLSRQNLEDTETVAPELWNRPNRFCRLDILTDSAAARELGDIDSEREREAIRESKEALVARGQANGIRFMTTGNEDDCVWYLTLCGVPRLVKAFNVPYEYLPMDGDWIDDRPTMFILNADLPTLYPLGTQGCDSISTLSELGCVAEPHGVALRDANVVRDITGFVTEALGDRS